MGTPNRKLMERAGGIGHPENGACLCRHLVGVGNDDAAQLHSSNNGAGGIFERVYGLDGPMEAALTESGPGLDSEGAPHNNLLASTVAKTLVGWKEVPRFDGLHEFSLIDM